MFQILTQGPLLPFIVISMSGLVVFLILTIGIYKIKSIENVLIARVKDLVNRKRNTVHAYEQRLRYLDTHAVDYMHSLGPDASKALGELRHTIASMNRILNEFDNWIIVKDLAALEDGERVLLGQPPILVTDPEGDEGEIDPLHENFDEEVARRIMFDPSTHLIFILKETYNLRGWEDRSEQHIQTLGRAIKKASDISSMSGLPKRRKRRSTSISLAKAGIVDDGKEEKKPENEDKYEPVH